MFFTESRILLENKKRTEEKYLKNTQEVHFSKPFFTNLILGFASLFEVRTYSEHLRLQ